MPDLFPTFDAPELVEENSEIVQYPKGWLFDFEKGDFVVDGSGNVVVCDGLTAWVQWCIKAVQTQRFAHLLYSPNYGAELLEAKKQPTRKAIESEIERTITESLLVDPRTRMVKDFVYRWSGDSVYVMFTVVPVIGDPKRLEVVVGG